jgi:undecaprenyl-diphosphatase
LIGLDEDLQRWVVTHRVDVLDHVFVALSVIGSLGAVWIITALFVALWRRRPTVLLHVTAGVYLTDLLTLLVKVLTDRERPYIDQPDPEPLVRAAFDLSFPSGHASTAFCGATLLTGYAPRLGVPLYVVAAGVAWSRVYVGVHYPLDVFAGALLGLLLGLALLSVPRVLRWPAAARPRSRRAPPPG